MRLPSMSDLTALARVTWLPQDCCCPKLYNAGIWKLFLYKVKAKKGKASPGP